MRVGVDYEQRKQKALRDYEKYLRVRGERDDNVDLGLLEQIVENLKKDRFSLAVAGEVSSGKSTFINALLGEYILPTDVLQNTCAVVEILKSPEPFLHVTYAKTENGRHKTATYKRDEALKKLRSVAAVPEEYRHIPFTLINSFLVEGVFDPPLEELQRRSKMTMQGKESLVRQYVKEFRDLSRIPIRVELGYPLNHTITDICIVDTPGVNAVGSIQDKTLSYINTANAILFLHPIKPVEAESFRTFVTENVTDRSRESLFLILSHAGVYTERDVESLLAEAKRTFHEIDSSRIFAVDSVLRLIGYDLRHKSVEEVMADEDKSNLLAKYYLKAREKEPLLKMVNAAANFDAVEDMIEELTSQAPNLPISDIYQRIETGYGNQRDAIKNEIKLRKEKQRSRQDFERRISKIRDNVKEHRLQANELGEHLHSKYLGVHGDLTTMRDRMSEDFAKRVDASCTDNEVKKHLLDFIQASGKQALESIVARLIEECNQRMKTIGGDFTKETDFAMPRIDVNALMQSARSNAYDYHKKKVRDDRETARATGGIGGAIVGGIIGFFVGGPYGAVVGAGLGGGGGAMAGDAVAEGPVYTTEKIFNEKKYLSSFKTDAKLKIKNACNSDIPIFMSKLIDSFVEDFRNEVEKNELKLNDELTRLEAEHKSNEKLIEEVDELSRRLNTLEQLLREVTIVKANLR